VASLEPYPISAVSASRRYTSSNSSGQLYSLKESAGAEGIITRCSIHGESLKYSSPRVEVDVAYVQLRSQTPSTQVRDKAAKPDRCYPLGICRRLFHRCSNSPLLQRQIESSTRSQPSAPSDSSQPRFEAAKSRQERDMACQRVYPAVSNKQLPNPLIQMFVRHAVHPIVFTRYVLYQVIPL
jgi:hypothetical protein